MRPSDVFDSVHSRVRDYMAHSAVGAVSMEPRTSGGPRRIGDWRAEYVADFRGAARRALLEGKRKGRKPRPLKAHWQLFEAYFMTFPPNASFGDEVSSAEVLNQHGRRVRKHTGLKERTFYRWVEQIKQLVGAELARCELFPGKSYRSRRVEAVAINED